jgi:hypothetical protein
MLTRQEIFDKAVGGVIKQGARSVEDGACVYRTEDGRKCVVGQLIDDAHYHPSLEGRRAGYPSVIAALKQSGVDGAGALLAALQDAHDNARGLNGFKQHARLIAAHYNLNPQVAS